MSCFFTDRVFGCHMLTLCERERTTVPKFVKLCVEELEKRGMAQKRWSFFKEIIVVVSFWLTDRCLYPVLTGLEADGLYRVSGNLAIIQKLRFLVDQGKFNSVIIYYQWLV